MTQVTLRPSGPGAYTEWLAQYPASGAHWDKVDDVVADDAATTVSVGQSTAFLRDLYTLPVSGIPAGSIINYVLMYLRLRVLPADSTFYPSPSFFLRTNSTDYQGAFFSDTDVWATETQQFNLNPVTGLPWTISEIDALQIGCRSDNAFLNTWGSVNNTQVYVVIDYTPPAAAGPTILGDGLTWIIQQLGLGAVYVLQAPLGMRALVAFFNAQRAPGDLSQLLLFTRRHGGGTPRSPRA